MKRHESQPIKAKLMIDYVLEINNTSVMIRGIANESNKVPNTSDTTEVRIVYFDLLAIMKRTRSI